MWGSDADLDWEATNFAYHGVPKDVVKFEERVHLEMEKGEVVCGEYCFMELILYAKEIRFSFIHY
jgi:hypothetical protein